MAVDVFDAMPSAGRKFLLAGKSGMNLTHAEDFEQFSQRYGSRRPQLKKALEFFRRMRFVIGCTSSVLILFAGSSGRVFPTDMKAAPLLRAWLNKLRETGVRFHASSLAWIRCEPAISIFLTTRRTGVRLLTSSSWRSVVELGTFGSDGRWFNYFADKDINFIHKTKQLPTNARGRLTSVRNSLACPSVKSGFICKR